MSVTTWDDIRGGFIVGFAEEAWKSGYSLSYDEIEKAAKSIADEWLAAHDAEVREQVAQEIERHSRMRRQLRIGRSQDPAEFAYATAAHIARGATS